jgi:hypothetical protein
MKKISFLIIIMVVGMLLVSCIPVEPKDMLPYCKAQYDQLLITDPDYPPAFIGACVSSLQTGKPTAFMALCGYEPFWAQLNETEGVNITSKKECINYIKNFGD